MRLLLLAWMLLLVGWGGLAAQSSFPQTDPVRLLNHLPAASVTWDGDELLTIEFPPLDLPPADGMGEGMIRTPVYRVDIPVSGSIFKYEVAVLDAAGNTLPRDRLHHVNVNDPDRRELFAPIMLHVLAAGKETPSPQVPWLLFGMPIDSGQRFVGSGMLANPEPNTGVGWRIRVILHLVKAGRPWPFWDAFPWVMDVLHPIGGPDGSKAFDLAPGRTERSWESSPAVDGTILGMGGHVHDYAVRLTLRDVTTAEVIWSVEPERDAAGHVIELPFVRFYRWYRLGRKIQSDHRYRVTVVYENPTGQTISDGGMGALAGLFVPDHVDRWPQADPTNPVYLEDLDNTLQHMGAGAGEPVEHQHHH